MVLNILLGEDDIKVLMILYLANNSHVNIIVSSNSILNVFINSFFVLFFLILSILFFDYTFTSF